MKRRKKGDYHLLVAQNFLGNISRTGKHDDTNLRIFNSSGLEKSVDNNIAIPVTEESSSVRFDLDPLEVDVLCGSPNIPALSPRKSHSSPAAPTEDPFSQSYPSYSYKSKSKKTSILRRLVKILSSDDVIGSRDYNENIPLTSRSTKETRTRRESTASEDRPPSPMSLSNFQFFRKLRASISKGERSYLCTHSTFAPFAVFAHFPFVTHERHHGHRLNRSHSTLAASTERMRHISQCSQDELRPYDFHDDDNSQISFGYLFGRRRGLSPCGAIGNSRKAERRESQYNNDSFNRTEGGNSETLATLSSYARDVSAFEPDEIEWDETTGDLYSPSVFDDIDATRKTVIRARGFVGVTVQYSNEETVKSALNQAFSEKFPRINLTYSKFKSIKKEMVDLAQMTNIDLSTTAQAIAYFERIVLKALISKSNRKSVAGACLLIAMKLNDYGKENIKKLIETASEKLRLPRKDLLALEIPLCAALSFDLQPSPTNVIPHYQKLLIACA